MARKPKSLYVLARGVSGRPACQHKLLDGTATQTACGAMLTNWSLEFHAAAVRVDPLQASRLPGLTHPPPKERRS